MVGPGHHIVCGEHMPIHHLVKAVRALWIVGWIDIQSIAKHTSGRVGIEIRQDDLGTRYSGKVWLKFWDRCTQFRDDQLGYGPGTLGTEMRGVIPVEIISRTRLRPDQVMMPNAD